MRKYIFEKFKQNIFILNYNDEENSIKLKKLIKIPITIELCDLNNEYNIYKIIEKTDYKNYFEKIENIYSFKNISVYDDLVIYIEHNDINIEIILNIKKLIDNNILAEKILIDNLLTIEDNDYINCDIENTITIINMSQKSNIIQKKN